MAAIKGKILAISMEIPWQFLQKDLPWTPDQLQLVADMDLDTLATLYRRLTRHSAALGKRD